MNVTFHSLETNRLPTRPLVGSREANSLSLISQVQCVGGPGCGRWQVGAGLLVPEALGRHEGTSGRCEGPGPQDVGASLAGAQRPRPACAGETLPDRGGVQADAGPEGEFPPSTVVQGGVTGESHRA